MNNIHVKIFSKEVQDYLRNIKKWEPESNEFAFSSGELDEIAESKSPFQKKPDTTVTAIAQKQQNLRSGQSAEIDNLLKSPQVFSLWPSLSAEMKPPTYSKQLFPMNAESRAKKLNDLILLTYAKSNYQKNGLLNQVLQEYLLNLTRMQVDDNGSAALKHSREVSENSILYRTTSILGLSRSNDPVCGMAADGEFIRDVNDCASFYTCFMGKPIKKSKCDKGLVFDTKIRVCNWESQVSCN